MSLKEKLSKVHSSITIERADNGWIFEVSGRDQQDDYKNIKILVNTSDTLYSLIQEHNEMEID